MEADPRKRRTIFRVTPRGSSGAELAGAPPWDCFHIVASCTLATTGTCMKVDTATLGRLLWRRYEGSSRLGQVSVVWPSGSRPGGPNVCVVQQVALKSKWPCWLMEVRENMGSSWGVLGKGTSVRWGAKMACGWGVPNGGASVPRVPRWLQAGEP